MVLGLGAKNTLIESLNSSFIECARNLAYILNEPTLNCFNIVDFNDAESVPHSHFKFALHPETPRYLESFLKSASQHEVNKASGADSNFSFEILDHSFLNLKLETLFVVRATNPNLQNLFYGPTKAEKLNLKRLSQFSGKNITFDEVFKLPHIFG